MNATNNGKIFIVDDMPANIGVLNNFLNNQGFTVLVAQDGESALFKIERAQPDLILLDIMMEGIDGFETCRRLKANVMTRDIPVIFTTALSDTVDKVQGLELGAVDYITKPFQQEEVLARINIHIKLRQLQKQLETNNSQLTRALKLKDEFLANISHELRTPLNAMLGASEILHEQIYGTLNEKQFYHLSMIERSGQHLLEIIGDLLDIAQLEADRLTLAVSSVLLKPLCQDLVDQYQDIAQEKQQTLLFSFDFADNCIQADAQRLKQILANLLSNAFKFTPKQGIVTFEVAMANTDYVRFAIKDNGPGIPADRIADLFEPFVQLDGSLSREYEGTGLGLPLVKKLTQLHEGWVEVKTTVGEGSCFEVFMPVNSLQLKRIKRQMN